VAGTTNTGASKLNMRAQASASAAILTKIPGGSTVEVLNTETSGWYQISFSGMTGYVASQYVDLTQAKAPAVEAATLRGRITDGPLNIRSGPSTSHSKCGKINAGTEVEILETLDGWYRIAEGYVSAGYVSLVTATPAQEVSAAPVVETPVEALVEVAAPESETLYGRVTTASLNVRSGPGTNYEKCGKVYAGKTVEILETLDGWYRIAEGYVSADYIRIVDASEAASSEVAAQVVETALSFLGYPYVYGGSTPKGFDCSGFTSYIYKQYGYSLNRTCSGQLDNGTPVAMSELQPGDLVIFKKYASSAGRASHVGIYIGGGEFIHASTSKVGVIISKLSDAYYTPGFVGGRRIV
jgi:cell wall-associated NlpC family hydrolase